MKLGRPDHRNPLVSRGFTMIELLVVMAILGVLAAAVLPLGETLLTAQKERDLRLALQDIRSALDAYKRAMDQSPVAGASGNTTGSGYPPSLQALVDGTPDTRVAAKGRMLYFLRAIPRDPFANPQVPAEQTWRLRSYASPATNWRCRCMTHRRRWQGTRWNLVCAVVVVRSLRRCPTHRLR